MFRIYRSTCRIKMRMDVWCNPLKTYCTGSEDNLATDKDTKLSRINEKYCLKVLNNTPLKQFGKYGIGRLDAEAIIKFRDSNGVFKSLHDLSLIGEQSPDILHNIINSINLMKLNRLNTVAPKITRLKEPPTILGIHVGPSVLSWALITDDYKLLDWDYENWSYMRNFDVYNLLTATIPIIGKLPDCSAYVTEFPRVTKIGSAVSVDSAQHRISFAIVYHFTMKAMSSEENTNGTMYMLKSGTSGRIFNLYLGRELLSTSYVMGNIQRNVIKIKGKKPMNINISNKIKDRLLAAHEHEQQQINWSLLKALSFLCMYEKEIR